MTTTDLAEFLLARIAEDEMWATEASRDGDWLIEGGAHWHWVEGEYWFAANLDPATDSLVGLGASAALISVEHETSSVPDFMVPQVVIREVEVRTTAAGHISRWDPARVLAECEAKRQIIELHARRHNPPGICRECGGIGSGVAVYWPCDTSKMLALPYAEHPDYLPEWRP